MATQLDRDFNNLDAKDLAAVRAHAVARIRVGEWTGDLARVMVQQVDAFHGEAAADAFQELVERELAKRTPL